MGNISRRGLKLSQNKRALIDDEIYSLPVPETVLLPLSRDPESPPEIVVEVGQRVKKYQNLTKIKEASVMPVLTPFSGKVAGIEELSHPIVGKVPFALIEVNPRQIKDKRQEREPYPLNLDDLINIAFVAGIVDESDGQPLYKKLLQIQQEEPAYIICDVIDDQPFVSSSLKCLLHYMEEAAEGLKLIGKAAGYKEIMFAIFTPDGVGDKFPLKIKEIPVHMYAPNYPARHAILDHIATSRNKTFEALGVQALAALYMVITYSLPPAKGIITVAGDGIGQPVNIEIPFGVPVLNVLKYCGVDKIPQRVVFGGCLTGVAVEDLSLPVLAGTKAVIALDETGFEQIGRCVGCGDCAVVCPKRLLPMKINEAYINDDIGNMAFYGAADCIGCGCCSYVCLCSCDVSAGIGKAREMLINESGVNL